MKQIWKYKLKEEADNLLNVPKGAKFISVAEQYDCPVLYVLVDLDETRTEEWVITTVGTGQPIPDKILSGKFLGTVPARGGLLVWHCWKWNQ